ncbi:MAG: hypothetical protein AABY62_00600 [Pseudomonadota bacterium]
MAFLTGWLNLVIMLLLAGNVVAIVIGITLMVSPGRAPAWFGQARQPRSVRQALKPLETVHDTDQLMLSRPRVLGVVLFVAAAIILVEGARIVSAVSTVQGGEILLKMFGGSLARRPLWEALWLSTVIFVTLGALFALAIGAAALFRPQLLKRWAAFANQWVSTRQAVKPYGGKPYYGVDRKLQEHPRTMGAVITLASLYVVAMLIWLLRA